MEESRNEWKGLEESEDEWYLCLKSKKEWEEKKLNPTPTKRTRSKA